MNTPPKWISLLGFVLTGMSVSVFAGAALSEPKPTETKCRLLEKPTLPLMGIVMFAKSKTFPDIDPYPSEDEISVISKMYRGLHVVGDVVGREMEASNPLWRRLRNQNPDFMILPYYQSTLSAELQLSAKLAEADPLNLISMYQEGMLDADLTPEANVFKVNPANTERGFGLKASTAPREFSESINEYVTILRIGDEIMRIIAVDSGRQEVTVLRGYRDTKAEAHPAGSIVFAPVYRGKKSSEEGVYGEGNSFPDCGDANPHKKLEYHLRLDSKKTSELLSESGARLIQNGATGLWLDLTSPGMFIPCNAFGDKVTPWNFESGAEYTKTGYLKHQERKVNGLREWIRQKTGIMPQIVANNHDKGKYFEKGGCGMDLVRPTAQKPIPINGVILEAAFSFYQLHNWETPQTWETSLSTLIHGSQNKYPVWPWIKNVRYAYLPMSQNDEAERYQFFDYTSTLLGYEKEAGVVCPMPLHRVDETGKRTLNLPDYLFYDLGDPVERVPYDQVGQMLIPGKNTYIRKWSKAIVLVNPSGTDDADIAIPDGYMDPSTNSKAGRISMPAHTGKILLKID